MGSTPSGSRIPPGPFIGIWKGRNTLLKIAGNGSISYHKTGGPNTTIMSSKSHYDAHGFWIGGSCGEPMLEGTYSTCSAGKPIFIVNGTVLHKNNASTLGTIAQINALELSAGIAAASAAASMASMPIVSVPV